MYVKNVIAFIAVLTYPTPPPVAPLVLLVGVHWIQYPSAPVPPPISVDPCAAKFLLS